MNIERTGPRTEQLHEQHVNRGSGKEQKTAEQATTAMAEEPATVDLNSSTGSSSEIPSYQKIARSPKGITSADLQARQEQIAANGRDTSRLDQLISGFEAADMNQDGSLDKGELRSYAAEAGIKSRGLGWVQGLGHYKRASAPDADTEPSVETPPLVEDPALANDALPTQETPPIDVVPPDALPQTGSAMTAGEAVATEVLLSNAAAPNTGINGEPLLDNPLG